MKLNHHIDKLNIHVANLSDKNTALISQIQQMNQTGGVFDLSIITPIDFNLEHIAVSPFDGEGEGCTINVKQDSSIEIVTHGEGYKVCDILTFEYGSKNYFVKVTKIETPTHMFMTNVTLDDIKFTIPVWTRIYQLLRPKIRH